MQLVAAAGIGGHRLQRPRAVPHLAHRRAAAITIEQRPEPLEKGDVFRLALVVEVILHAVGIDVGRIIARRIRIRHQRRIVPEMAVVEIEVHGIEPETVDATVEPEARCIQHCILNIRIVEIEVRLRGKEVVHVILLAHPVPFPGRSAEDRKPVVRRGAIRLRIGPDIPVCLRILAAGPAFDEPGMAGRMNAKSPDR